MASQQGKYLGKKFSTIARRGAEYDAKKIDIDDTVAQPFSYTHLGSLAYIGNAAVFDMGNWSFMGGLAAMYAWRSVYWSEGVSARWVLTRCAKASANGAQDSRAAHDGLDHSVCACSLKLFNVLTVCAVGFGAEICRHRSHFMHIYSVNTSHGQLCSSLVLLPLYGANQSNSAGE